ncbi:MAG: hypothetical protein IJP31_08180 [Lachnospiraceae bacterium]|nr:hypothetical protein [Lachnospiraceae bacterium]
MKKRFDKILLGIEAVIYGVIIIFFIGIVSSIWNYKYGKIGDWKAFLGYLNIGIVIPFLGIVAANILLYRKKTKEIVVERIIGIILIPYIIITIFCGTVLAFGGAVWSETNKVEDYKKYDIEVEEALKGYGDIFPETEEKGIALLKYHYKYVRTFDDNFEIKVVTQYQDEEMMRNKIEYLQKAYGIHPVEETKGATYQYGKCLIECDEIEKKITYEVKY